MTKQNTMSKWIRVHFSDPIGPMNPSLKNRVRSTNMKQGMTVNRSCRDPNYIGSCLKKNIAIKKAKCLENEFQSSVAWATPDHT